MVLPDNGGSLVISLLKALSGYWTFLQGENLGFDCWLDRTTTVFVDSYLYEGVILEKLFRRQGIHY
jgi:hypothetical protein